MLTDPLILATIRAALQNLRLNLELCELENARWSSSLAVLRSFVEDEGLSFGAAIQLVANAEAAALIAVGQD